MLMKFDKLPNCDIVSMKLKRKGNVFFKAVNLKKVCRALAHLKQSNHIYSGTKIEIDSIASSFCYSIENNEIVDTTYKDKMVIDFNVEKEDSDRNEDENRNHYLNTGILKMKH